MKKTLSVILTLLLLFACLPTAFAAEEPVIDPAYPTIIVAGYSSSSLYLNTENGPKKVWGVNVNDILQEVLHNIAKVGLSLGALTVGKTDYLADTVGEGAVDLYGVLACNPDGSSVNDLSTFPQEAAKTQFSYLYASGNGDQTHESEIMADIAALYGEDGYDHIFCFMHDFRKNIIFAAETLDRYIDDVLAFTGAEKVNLFAVSHGGEICAVYFSEYGHKNVVHNAVLTVPAIGGAALAYDVMSGNIVFDEDTLLNFIQNGMMLQEDYDWLVKASQLGFLDPLCNRIAGNWVVPKIMGYWGSIWDFIPAEYYDELKNEQLDPVESADLIAKSDYFHHEILANIRETFAACADKGMNLYIVAGSGMPAVTGLQEQSDMVITVNASTGARTAPYGSRFSDGYPQERAVCADETHNHLSPDMCVDVSGGYLPDQTWIVNGMYHGNAWRDEYSKDLCLKLFFSDERMNVYTDPAYPQFRYSSSVNYAVTATLDRSPQGYWSGEDTALTVTNLSQKYKMQLISVSVDGVDAAFGVKGIVSLE
ncbi:MAG: hypothetical protein IJK98_09955, partial [Clostridia bacterium]|nr:hypothetical protein [Clostridia bacterium]